jgi:type VI secretion system secreted protein VgrG
VRVEIASGDPLDVRSFAITERVSELSRVEVRAVSRCLTIDFDEVVGKDASFELATATWVRRATGVVSEIEQVRVDEAGLATYRVVLVPRAWLMSQRKNYRIFQYLSELAIVEKLLGEWGLDYEARIGREHKPRKYRVQYDESDLDFVTRMLSDAGIAFFFETTDGGTKLVLDD